MPLDVDDRSSLSLRFAEAREGAINASYSGQGDNRGIVICAGGARLFTCAWVAIGLLRRHLGCTLPIQIWHLGEEELGPAMRDMISRFDVEVVDAFEMARDHPVSRLAGWELKPYALMHSRFREVMLLDADNMPVEDPSFLFEHIAYQQSGALFWPDVVRIRRDNPIWGTTGLAPWTRASVESGQLIVDKARCWPALVLTQWMNQNAGEFYDMIWGDKDTFLISWLATNTPFKLNEFAPDQLDGVLCHKGPDGQVLFQHRTNAKWTLVGRSAPVEGYRLHDESVALLRELAREWDGWIFNPPKRSDAARQMEAQLERQGLFLLTRVSVDQKKIRLNSGHRIGEGRGHDLVYWHMADGAEGLELVLRQGQFVSARLRQTSRGWEGDWLQAPYTPVDMIPVEAEVSYYRSEQDASLELLLEDIWRAFDARSANAAERKCQAESMALIARVRPQAANWLKARSQCAMATPLCRQVALEALSMIGVKGHRHPSHDTVERLGLEVTHGYERD